MTDRQDALRATTEDLIADAETLQELETAKAALDPDDPRQDRLAEDVVRLVRDMGPKAAAQQEIIEDTDEGWSGIGGGATTFASLTPEPGLEP